MLRLASGPKRTGSVPVSIFRAPQELQRLFCSLDAEAFRLEVVQHPAAVELEERADVIVGPFDDGEDAQADGRASAQGLHA